MTSRGGTRRREISLAAAGVWLIVLASDGTASRLSGGSPQAPDTAVRPDHPIPRVVKSSSEGDIGFLPVPLRSVGIGSGFRDPRTIAWCKLGIADCCIPSEFIAQIPRAHLCFPPL